MSYAKPTVRKMQVSWPLPWEEFSAKDNPYRFTQHITLFLLHRFSVVDGNHLCTWEQADGLLSAAGGRSLSLQSRLQQPPKEQQLSQVLAPPSPLPSSVSPTTALPQPKAHRCPTSRAANYSALSLEAATSRSATTAGTPRGTSLGR